MSKRTEMIEARIAFVEQDIIHCENEKYAALTIARDFWWCSRLKAVKEELCFLKSLLEMSEDE